MIYDSGRDRILVDGQPEFEPPRYRYAVRIATDEDAPIGLHFSNNSFDTGFVGVAAGDAQAASQ